MSATTGVRSATAPKSSMSRAMPNSWAMARVCSTPLVEPPVAAMLAMPFSSDRRSTKADGRTSRWTRSMTISPAWRAASSLAGSSAGMPLRPAGERPMNSRTVDIVLAVYWPPHAPGPGQATFSTSYSSSRVILPGPVGADGLEHADHGHVALALVGARVDRPAVQHQAGHIQATEGHGRAGDGLVAADQADHAIEQVAAHDQLDRVGHDLAADQAGLHALGAHRHAVADADAC